MATLHREPIGNNCLIKRFMRGIFNKRPSLPRYAATWDVSLVLNFLRISCPGDVSLKELSMRTATLMALATGQRVQTLRSLTIDASCLNIKGDTCTIYTDAILKQTRPGHHLAPITIKNLANKNICLLHHLSVYLSRTATLRGDHKDLFISSQKPFKPVSKDTISRWIRGTLSQAGVDTTVFGAHSTRSASTTAASAAGAPVDLIMSVAGWSSERTFANHYKRPISINENFSDYVLQT